MTRETAYCFAADLGGTKLAAAMADARGRIVAELTEPTDPRGGPTSPNRSSPAPTSWRKPPGSKSRGRVMSWWEFPERSILAPAVFP